MKKEKTKEKKKLSKKRIIGLIVCAAMFIGAGTDYILTRKEITETQESYENLEDDIFGTTEEEPKEEKKTFIEWIEDILGLSANAEEISINEVNNLGIKIESINWEKLYEINNESIAWIKQPETVISYPVLYRENDNEYYLTHDINGKKVTAASIYLDSRCEEDFSLPFNILYGHKMKDGTMFGSLHGYKKQDYLQEHPYLILYTEDQNYLLEVFSATIVSGSNTWYPVGDYNTPEITNEFVTEMRENSLIQSNLAITEEDKIMCLCTCTYEEKNSRLFVLCKMSPIVNELEKGTSK